MLGCTVSISSAFLLFSKGFLNFGVLNDEFKSPATQEIAGKEKLPGVPKEYDAAVIVMLCPQRILPVYFSRFPVPYSVSRNRIYLT